MPRTMSDAPSFAGYPLLEALGPCPGGTAYRSLHPLDGRPVVVRRLDPAAVGDVAAFAARARAAQAVEHPHLARLVDAGEIGGEPFAVLEPLAGAGLTALLADIGPMPADLAAGFAAHLAGALAAAHAAGLAHGNVSADRVVVGPLEPIPDTPRRRPAAGATATLLDLGLVPAGTTADDLRGLGDTVYRMLVGRDPSAADPPLAALRPDAPSDLRAVVNELLAADPAVRPAAAAAADRFVPPEVVEVAVPRGRPAPGSRKSLYVWLAVGGVLNLIGLGLFAYIVFR